MSAGAWYFLADWDTFVNRYREVGSGEAYDTTFYESDEPWLESLDPTPWHESHSWSPQLTVFELHDVSAEHLEPNFRKRLETLLAAFGLIHSEAANDVHNSSGLIAITMAPDTVRKIVSASLPLEIEPLRPYYDKHLGDDEERWLETFDEIKQFIEGFITLLTEADSKSKGIVIKIG